VTDPAGRHWRGWLRAYRAGLVGHAPAGPPAPRAQLVRRRAVVVATLLVGAGLLRASLTLPPGSAAFAPLTLALAATWLLGGLLSGPLPLGRRDGIGPAVLSPVVTGALLGLAFLIGALVVQQVAVLRQAVQDVFAHDLAGGTPVVAALALVNAVAEEVFFRGALYAAVGGQPVLRSTLVYAATTVVTGNGMLVFAALTVGAVLGLQRRASGGVLAPALTHATWSMIMVYALPPLLTR
jgi:membrane protease YdiL (CAAX protease family)